METSTHFQEAGHTPANRHSPSRRLCDSTQNLKKRALARAIPANDSENIPFLNFKAHVVQRPKLLDFIPLNDLPALGKVDGFAHKVLRFSRQHLTKSRVLRILVMSKQVLLRQIFDANDVIGHWCLSDGT